MRYQLVVQWSGASLGDYDEMIEIEDALLARMTTGTVDGHDLGDQEANIFIQTDDPSRAWDEVMSVIALEKWQQARAAHRHVDAAEYTILWPQGLMQFRVR